MPAIAPVIDERGRAHPDGLDDMQPLGPNRSRRVAQTVPCHIRDAADIRQCDASIVDQLALNQRVDVPLVAELLPYRDRQLGALAHDLIGVDIFTADQVLTKITS